jgi:hypothetical protein
LQGLADLAARPGPLLEQLPASGRNLVDVEAGKGLAERAVPELSPRHRAKQGLDRKVVSRGQQVDGGPHHHHRADRTAVLEQRGQVIGREALQACPERVVGIARHLGLHADQALDRLGGGKLHATKQHLPLQQGTVQGPRAEDLVDHGPTIGAVDT